MRNLDITYITITYGVFAQGVSGRLYTSDEWAEQEELNGVAVITENCMFLVRNNLMSSELHAFPDFTIPDGLPIYDSPSTDYDGKGNTDKFLALNSSESYAAGYCHSCITPNGQHGYIPSYGEWVTFYRNRTAIYNFFYIDSMYTVVWTSSLEPYKDSFTGEAYTASVSCKGGNIDGVYLSKIDSEMEPKPVVPFFPLVV